MSQLKATLTIIFRRTAARTTKEMLGAAVCGALIAPWIGSTNAAVCAVLVYLAADLCLYNDVMKLSAAAQQAQTPTVAAEQISPVQLTSNPTAVLAEEDPLAALHAPLGAATHMGDARILSHQSAAESADTSSFSAPKGLKLSVGGVICYANAAEPTPFANEFCSGTMLFLCKTDPPSARAAHFEGKSKMFEMQIQGRLHKVPEGQLISYKHDAGLARLDKSLNSWTMTGSAAQITQQHSRTNAFVRPPGSLNRSLAQCGLAYVDAIPQARCTWALS